MTERKKSPGRRTFLTALVTGAGAAVALVSAAPKAAATKEQPAERPATDPILYRRTEDVERYYRTLYQ